MAQRGAELIERGFYRFVREERHFCTILVQLLLAKNGNLEAFLNLANLKLGGAPLLTGDAEGAEIYTEFSVLCDDWNSPGRDNDAKRARITGLLKRAGMAGHVGGLPESVPELDEFFIGAPGSFGTLPTRAAGACPYWPVDSVQSERREPAGIARRVGGGDNVARAAAGVAAMQHLQGF